MVVGVTDFDSGHITTKPVVSVWLIHFSTYFYDLVRFTKIYHFFICIYILFLLDQSISGMN